MHPDQQFDDDEIDDEIAGRLDPPPEKPVQRMETYPLPVVPRKKRRDRAEFSDVDLKKVMDQLPELEKHHEAYERKSIPRFYQWLRKRHPRIYWQQHYVYQHLTRYAKPKWEPRRLRIQLALRCGWFEKFTIEKHEKLTAKMLKEETFKKHEMYDLPMDDWARYVLERRLYDLPNPLPYIRDSRKQQDGDFSKAELSAEALRKSQVKMTFKDSVMWAYTNMCRPGLTIFDAPAGTAFAFYEIAQKDLGKFVRDYVDQYREKEVEKDKERQKLGEDDQRRHFKVIRNLMKQKAAAE